MMRLGWILVAVPLVTGCSGPATPGPRPPSTAPAPGGSAGPTAPPTPTGASAIAGAYEAPHEVMMVCEEEDGCVEQVLDTMVLTATPAGRLRTTIELVRTNGHTCSFEQELVQTTPSTWRFEEGDVEDPEASCVLTLTHGATTVDISSEGCRDYCGVRAALDASFPFPPARR